MTAITHSPAYSPTHSYTQPETMTKKDRETIKDLYTAFNTELEEVANIQRHYAVPDDVSGQGCC